MKANEAPEKIYMNWVNYPLEEVQVEYTRTDAFIAKAVNYLNCNLSGVVAIKDGNITQGLLRTKSEFIEDFKNNIKEE